MLRPAALLLTLLLALPAHAAGTPEAEGPYATASETESIQAGPAQVSATVCIPDNVPGPMPVLAVATSSVESKDVLGGLCLHLASYGMLVAVPDLGFANTDATSTGQTLQDVLAFFVREGGRSGSRFFGKIDGRHRGVVGFSTGALAALSAARDDPTLSAAVLLDPQDVNGQGRALAPLVTSVPVLMVRADPGLCNNQDNFRFVYDLLPGPRETMHVYDSKACDAELPASNQCQATCGPVRAYAAARFQRYVTAWTGFYVGCNASLRSYVDGAGVRAEVEDLTLDHFDAQALPTRCGPFVEPDAGPPDAGPDAGPAEAPGGCGCSPTRSGTPPWGLALLVLGAVAWRRRTPALSRQRERGSS